MRKAFFFTAVSMVALMLAGCPLNTTQRGQIAQALHQTSIVVMDAEQAEIIAYHQGLVPADEHILIQQQFLSVGELGKATDDCVKSAGATAAALACLKGELATLDTINAQGGLHLKSPQAKADFAAAMNSAKAVVQGIYIALGGK
jgi:hypothetical protein